MPACSRISSRIIVIGGCSLAPGRGTAYDGLNMLSIPSKLSMRNDQQRPEVPMDFQTEYPRFAARSGELFKSASEIIPGARMTDVDGHEYIDYLLGLGPDILGHRHPVVTKAVAEAIAEYGTSFGLPYELDIRAAQKVIDAVPSLEMLRFTNSGSEAVGTAVRLARAHTGRRLLVRFEGHYHGWQDVVYWSNHVDPDEAGPADHPRPVASGPGVPQELADTLIAVSYTHLTLPTKRIV